MFQARYLAWKRHNAKRAGEYVAAELKRKAVESWSECVDVRRQERAKLQRFAKMRLRAAFHAWIRVQSESATREILVRRMRSKLRARLLRETFYGFCDAIVADINERNECDPASLHRKIAELEAQSHKLQLENNRYGKFVDTADLGRGRMKQLSEAVSSLQNEGTELKDLVSLMRTDYENMSREGGGVQGMKQTRVLTESALQRNKMLVKGGSSFNALIRALKQDLVDSRKPKRKMGDENILYEVDRLSLDEVTVFPDGEIKVKAVPPEPRDEVLRYGAGGHGGGHAASMAAAAARKKREEALPPAYVPTGGRSAKLGSQTAITSALKKLSRDELGKLEKYLDASARKSQDLGDGQRAAKGKGPAASSSRR